MFTHPRLPSPVLARVGTALAGVVLLLAAAACTSPTTTDPTTGPTTTGPTTTGPTAGSSSAAVPSDTTPPTAGGVSTDAAGVVVIDIVLSDGTVEPDGARIELERGQTVVLRVISDQDLALHLHMDPEVELEVKAGVLATTTFVPQQAGTFELETHHPDHFVAQVNVR